MFDFASYDNLRKIASYIDGQKNTARKILYTVIDKNIVKEIKVDQLSNKMAEHCIAPETMINLADGSQINIEEWESKYPGTNFMVECVDENGNRQTSTGYAPRITKEVTELIEISIGTDIIRCTLDHKIFVKRDDSLIWIEAQDIVENDIIVDAEDMKMRVHKVQRVKLDKPIKVYDISVEKYHNFSVGDSKSIFHNCQYLHGGAQGVIVTMAQNYTGTNNLPVLTREGNFGTRFSPEASAPRYIYTMKEKYTDKLFLKADNDILIGQEFEGDKIEPRFFVPTLPLLLINGSEGISSGFAQKILARNPVEIQKYIENKINSNNKQIDLKPFFNGFAGTIEQAEESNKWFIKGAFRRKNLTSIEIVELPVGYNLKSYIKVLDKLEDDKVIRSYKDLSDGDTFHFVVNIESKALKAWSDDTVLDKMKLIKKVSENYTCMDENNKIRVFGSATEILDAFIDIRLEYFTKRKTSQLASIKNSLRILASKYIFINSVIQGKIEVNNKKKQEITEQIEQVENIRPSEGSFDFLLRMPIYSLTEEKVQELLKAIQEGKAEYGVVSKTDETAMWNNDLKAL